MRTVFGQRPEGDAHRSGTRRRLARRNAANLIVDYVAATMPRAAVPETTKLGPTLHDGENNRIQSNSCTNTTRLSTAPALHIYEKIRFICLDAFDSDFA